MGECTTYIGFLSRIIQLEAINKGFRLAKGEIIGWLDSSDTYLPRAVSSTVEHLLNHPRFGWIDRDSYWINENSQV